MKLMKPIRFPILSRAQHELNNVVCERNPQFEVTIVGKSVQVGILAYKQKLTPAISISLQIGPFEATWICDKNIIAFCIGEHIRFQELPVSLKIACVEIALEGVLDAMTQYLGYQVQVKNIKSEESECDSSVSMEIMLKSENEYSCGRLFLDEGLGNYLCTRLPIKKPPTLEKWFYIEIQIQCVVAVTTLRLHELNDIVINDIILFDACYMSESDELLLVVPGQCCYRAKYAENRLAILEMKEKRMPSSGLNSSNLEDLEIDVVFQLKEIKLTLGELSNLQPGYSFDMGLDLSAPVTLKANGLEIAKCQLVEIENRLGARIVSINDTLAMKYWEV